MEKEVLDKLDELISEGENWCSKIIYQKSLNRSGVVYMGSYVVDDKINYEKWRQTSQKFVKIYGNEDITDFIKVSDRLSSSNHNKMLSILVGIKSLSHLPKPIKHEGVTTPLVSVLQTNNQSQSQTQSQELAVSIFIESIKDELTGKQQKEIKAILEEYKDKPKEVKPKVIDKLKSFGSDVVSNILANIITNPSIWNGF